MSLAATTDTALAANPGTLVERRAMVDSQLRVSGVNDPAVLAAFLAVPREDHVPTSRRTLAYIDRPIALDGGAVLAAPLSHGQMLIAAAPRANDTVLVVGTPGTYLAALVRELGASVTIAAPGSDLAALGPFSLILIDGAIEQVDPAFAAALGAGGRLVTGLIERGVSRLALGQVAAGGLALTTLGDADFAPLAAYAAPKAWRF